MNGDSGSSTIESMTDDESTAAENVTFTKIVALLFLAAGSRLCCFRRGEEPDATTSIKAGLAAGGNLEVR